MTSFAVIPAIDLLNGKVVRLTKGDYNQVSYYDITPAELAKKYSHHGASRIHIVDLNGAKAGKLINLDSIKAIRKAVDCTIELGGGNSNEETNNQLLNEGLGLLVLGSLLIENPAEAKKLIEKHPHKLIAGLDTKNKKISVEGWIKESTHTVESLLETFNELPLESIIITDISRDGTLEGPNLKHLSDITKLSKHPVIASGGVGTGNDIDAIQKLTHQGIIGCIVGKAIMENKVDLSKLWKTSNNG